MAVIVHPFVNILLTNVNPCQQASRSHIAVLPQGQRSFMSLLESHSIYFLALLKKQYEFYMLENRTDLQR